MSTYRKSIIEDIVIYPPEDPYSIPVTVSKNFLKLKSLQQENKFNEAYIAAIQTLQSKFAGWKRIRGDGNCYYRSVISSYIIKILHPYSDNLELTNFVSKLQKAKDCSYAYDLLDSVETMIDHFTKVLNSRKSPKEKIDHFRKIHIDLQNKEFDKDLVCASRAIALSSLDLEDEMIIKIYFCDPIDFTVNHVLTYGNEAEGIELKMLPVGLDIKVIQYNNEMNGRMMKNEFFNDFEEKERSEIFIICKTRGHYDILQSTRDLENENYNYAMRCYSLDQMKIKKE